MRTASLLFQLPGLLSVCLSSATLLLLPAVLCPPRAAGAADPVVLVSSFTAAPAGGILSFRLDPATGTLTPGPRSPAIPNPFFFDVSPDRRRLYSIHAETFGGTAPESLAAFELNLSAELLQPLNRESTRGTASCFVEVDRTVCSLQTTAAVMCSPAASKTTDNSLLLCPSSVTADAA
jgi:6-phosphogluconolactonase (cycloisomerase 2 family)